MKRIPPAALWGQPRPRLWRSRPDSPDMPSPWIAGVCSGVAVHARVSVTWVRVLFCLFVLLFGAGFFLYVWLWVTVPVEPRIAGRVYGGATPLARVGQLRWKGRVSGQLLLAGLVFLAVALLVLLRRQWGVFDTTVVLPVIGIVAGLVMAWTQVPNISDWKSPRVLALIGSGTTLVVVSAVFLVARGDPVGALLRGALVGVVVLVGATVALAPIWMGLIKSLALTRESAARETERADIAAHLHDSVLQTLTLIRANADNPSKVRTLALGQERELRAWLYTGKDDPGTSVAEALREQVQTVEVDHGEEIAVVAVGDVSPGPAEQAAIAAAAEAARNAAKHGAPPISVYMEVTPDVLEVFVKDGGSGFVVDEIPPDRHGVKDSIMGRVLRVGGTVVIRTQEEGFVGTEVQIRVPLSEVEKEES